MIPISDGNKELTHEMQSSPERLKADALSREIIGSAIEVHRHLGPGLFESVNVRMLRDGITRLVNG